VETLVPVGHSLAARADQTGGPNDQEALWSCPGSVDSQPLSVFPS